VTPGFYPNLPAERYHKSAGLSSHGLVSIIKESPRHFHGKYVLRLGQSDKVTPAKAFGDLCHKAMLERDRFRQHNIVAPDFGHQGVKANKEAKQAWYAALSPEAIVSTQDESDTLRWMIDAIDEHADAKYLLSNGVQEVSGWWVDPKSKELCRLRVDWLRRDLTFVDYKTTRSVTRRRFAADIWGYGYYLSAEHYLSGGTILLERACNEWYWVAQEKEYPYAVAVYEPDEMMKIKGQQDRERAIEKYQKCKERGHWPSIQSMAEQISLPQYAFYEEENDDE
jgi:hypothetical protein